MNIEQLSKSQLILLTLLVSFVSSVATGIVTVTLMEQAPLAITQTVNRVVERTIEKVVPESMVAGASATVETVVIREGDLIAEAVAQIEPSIVRLFTPGRDTAGNDIQIFVGIAVVANSSGLLFVDPSTPNGPLTGVRSDGVKVPLSIETRVDGAKLVTIQAPSKVDVQTAEGRTETKDITWTSATFKGELSQLGQTVVAISGRDATKIARGSVVGVQNADPAKQALETDIAAGGYVAGSPLLNTDGEVVGMATQELRTAGTGFLASPSIVLYSESATD